MVEAPTLGVLTAGFSLFSKGLLSQKFLGKIFCPVFFRRFA